MGNLGSCPAAPTPYAFAIGYGGTGPSYAGSSQSLTSPPDADKSEGRFTE